MDVTLFTNSGLQFVDLRCPPQSDGTGLRNRFEVVLPLVSGDPPAFELRTVDRDPLSGKPTADGEAFEEDAVISLQTAKALAVFEASWLPVPYFRTTSFETGANARFRPGPIAWARAWFRRSEDGGLSCVLAFDTTSLSPDSPSEEYLASSTTDAGNCVFRMADRLEDLEPLLKNEVLSDWIWSVFARESRRVGYTIAREPRDSEEQYMVRCQMHAYAMYVCLLRGLTATGTMPEVRLLNVPVSGDMKVFIDTDLVVDIGNSRSCGLLVETNAPQRSFGFDRCARLGIRDFGQPDTVRDDPFPMMVEFCRADFGIHDTSTQEFGWPSSFHWPSSVRVGEEARRRAVLKSTSRPTGLSSPKRYLWDDRARVDSWVFNEVISPNGLPKPVFDEVTTLIDGKGDYIEKDDAARVNAQDPRYSRKSLMYFALIEVILHALTQINSYSHRSEKGQPHLPRRLRRIVVTCPTAMTLEERYRLRKLAQDAASTVRRLYTSIGLAETLQVMPDPARVNPMRVTNALSDTTEWSFDEATCVQLVYLYGEISDRFDNDCSRFLEFTGRRRTGMGIGDDRPSFTLASLDIGGGTTDLMICNYQQSSDQSNATVLTATPLFWDGFNVAGDDILKSIVESVILPGLCDDFVRRGLGKDQADSLVAYLFGSNNGPARHQAFRARFASEAALPMAEFCLEFIARRDASEELRFAQFFERRDMPHPETIETLNDHVRQSGLPRFDVRESSWTLKPVDIEAAIRRTMYPMLLRLCGVVAQYECDALLLAGRPSALPPVRCMVQEMVAVRPSRLLSMSEFRVGDWYPFSRGIGPIEDAKTTVCVGAVIGLVGGYLNRLEAFRVDLSRMALADGGHGCITSTHRFVGPMAARTGDRLSERWFTAEDAGTGETVVRDRVAIGGREVRYLFDAPMRFGSRQFDTDRWPATPLLRLDFASAEIATKFRGGDLPLTLTIERRGYEEFRLREVVNNKGVSIPLTHLELSLQTMLSDGHWVDTGVFVTARHSS